MATMSLFCLLDSHHDAAFNDFYRCSRLEGPLSPMAEFQHGPNFHTHVRRTHLRHLVGWQRRQNAFGTLQALKKFHLTRRACVQPSPAVTRGGVGHTCGRVRRHYYTFYLGLQRRPTWWYMRPSYHHDQPVLVFLPTRVAGSHDETPNVAWRIRTWSFQRTKLWWWALLELAHARFSACRRCGHAQRRQTQQPIESILPPSVRSSCLHRNLTFSPRKLCKMAMPTWALQYHRKRSVSLSRNLAPSSWKKNGKLQFECLTR